jgi:FtsZ-interacting cell division protein ZipA
MVSGVTGGGQAIGASGAGLLAGEPYTCPPLTEISDYVDTTRSAHPSRSFPVELESTELAPQVRWPQSKKRIRDPPTRKEQPSDETRAEKPVIDYQRKPRHRTREDRYEYKIAGSTRKHASEAPEQKTKRQRRSRKQAMNDGFHASNVARNRLTV